MVVTTVDGDLLRKLFLGGAANLELNRAYVDSLNVFPVPDGDTGTNMSMTMQGAVKELASIPEGASVSAVMDAVSIGALKNARGNSGVILSQLFRGFSASLKGASTFSALDFAKALETGSNKAYKAVMRPKEGTILTVSRMIAEACVAQANENGDVTFDQLMETVLSSGDDALKKTPDLLPVLKEAGVVDSRRKKKKPSWRKNREAARILNPSARRISNLDTAPSSLSSISRTDSASRILTVFVITTTASAIRLFLHPAMIL